MKKEFRIYEHNYIKLKNRFIQLKKKANKYEIPFNYQKIREEYDTLWYNPSIDEYVNEQQDNCRKVTFKVYIIEIEAEQVKMNDWIFIATLEHKDNGNVVRKIENVEIPDKYYTTTTICEHCGTVRRRKDTYLVQNVVTKEFKQVGKSCLRDFLGHITAEKMAAFYESLGQYEIEGQYNPPRGENYYDLNEILNIGIQVVDKYGYFNREKADEYLKLTTKDKILYYMDNLEMMIKDNIEYRTNNDREVKINKMLDWICFIEANNEYIRNLQVITGSDHIQYRDLAILVSLIPSYYKAMERMEKEVKITNEYFGEVGEKYELKLTVNKKFQSETDFGIMNIYKMSDSIGRLFTWFTGGYLEEGKTYTMKARIKSHGEYKNNKETIITRPSKIQEVI